jgi:heme-degrading monooxygenase HmoA
VFRSRLRADAKPEYDAHAAQISDLAGTMPGYVEHKSFTAEDGERLTLVTFEDMASQNAWRTQADHVSAQRKGIEAYYETYSIQVATVERASTFTED